MLNTLVLFSGSSKAFTDAGYLYPKNLTDIGGSPLVQCVLERLLPLKTIGSRLICILNRNENRLHHTGAVIRLVALDALVIELPGPTGGAACSALLAVEHINNSEPLLIINGDQLLLDVDLRTVIEDFQSHAFDGGIVVFRDIHPRWSFVKCNKDGLVIEAAEKRPISKLATAGVYYFAKGIDFVISVTEMIKKDSHVNGQFYICPSYNEMILRQKRIGIFEIPKSAYHSLATPSDVLAFNSQAQSQRGD